METERETRERATPTKGFKTPGVSLGLRRSGLGIVTSFISAVQEIGVNRRKLEKLSNELLQMHVVARPNDEHTEMRKKLWNDMRQGRDKLAHIVGADLNTGVSKPIEPFIRAGKKLWGNVAKVTISDATGGVSNSAVHPADATTDAAAPALITVVRASSRSFGSLGDATAQIDAASGSTAAAERYRLQHEASPETAPAMDRPAEDAGGPDAPDAAPARPARTLLYDDFSRKWIDPDAISFRIKTS